MGAGASKKQPPPGGQWRLPAPAGSDAHPSAGPQLDGCYRTFVTGSSALDDSSLGATCYLRERSAAAGCSGNPPAAAARGACDSRRAGGAISMELLMSQVHGFQAALAAVSDTPGLGLSEAAELLLGELDASLVSIHCFCDCTEADTQQPQSVDLLQPQPRASSYPVCAVLLAACGNGAESLERSPVVTDPAASCLLLPASGLDSLAASATHFRSGNTVAPARPLPADWEALRCNSGLQSFLAVPIGPVVRPWGVLTLAAEAPDALSRPRWQAWPGVAAVALVHLVRHWQCAEAARLLWHAAASEDPVDFVTAIVQGTRTFMERALNTQVGVRLALLAGSPSNRALVFEPSAGPGQPGCGDLIATEMSLAGTLLASALSPPRGRFIHDCASYMQSSPQPVRDIFTNPHQLVSSLVVVPLIMGDGPPVAALYLSLEAPNSFANVQPPLLGLVNVIKGLSHKRLSESIPEIWRRASAVRTAAASAHQLQRAGAALAAATDAEAAVPRGLILLGSDGPHELPPSSSAPTSGSGSGIGAAGRGPAPPAAPCGSPTAAAAAEGPRSGLSSGGDGPTSGRIASCRLQRVCTTSMLKVAEHKIQAGKSHRSSTDLRSLGSEERLYQLSLGLAGTTASGGMGASLSTSEPYPCDLALTELIGVGGYGTVWRGTWRRVTAAIKVMHHRGTEQEAMMDAVEMAVLSAVSHPNVVQVFACLTDMVEVPADSSSSPRGSGGPASAAFLPSFDRGNGGGGSAAPSQAGGLMAGGLGRRRGPGPEGPVPPPAPSYRRLLPFEDPEDAPTCSVVVMEYCDLGTLRRMAQRGLFHQRIGGGPAGASGSSMGGSSVGHAGGTIGVDLAALVEVALQVAEALAYLHSIRLCHCDVKLDNVLLKSEVSQPRGYIAKLGDMGLVKVLGAADAVVNVACAGTVNHLAPELFTPGSRLTTAVDVYAFGILLYELYMAGATAYAGLSKSAIIERVARAGMRPRFPAGAPRAYVELAAACWAQDPAHRPGFGSIIASLDLVRRTAASLSRPAAADRAD